MKRIIALCVIGLLSLIALIISSQNSDVVQLNFILAKQPFALSEVLSIFFFIGFSIACIGWWIFFTKTKLKMYQQKRKIAQLQNDNERLRIQLKD